MPIKFSYRFSLPRSKSMLWVPDCAERTFVSEFAGSPRWHLPSDVRLDTMHFDPYTVRTHKLDIILKISYKRSHVLRHIFQRVEMTSKKILPQFGKGPSIPCLSLGSRRTFCRWTCSISTRSRRRLSWTRGFQPHFKCAFRYGQLLHCNFLTSFRNHC